MRAENDPRYLQRHDRLYGPFYGHETDMAPNVRGDYEEEPENMSIFIEADTGDKYFYDAGTHVWVQCGDGS